MVLNIFKKKKKNVKEDKFHYMLPEEFYSIYKYCPRCGNSDYVETHNRVVHIKNTHFTDDVNFFRCRVCGFKSKRNEMISYEELNRRLKG